MWDKFRCRWVPKPLQTHTFTCASRTQTGKININQSNNSLWEKIKNKNSKRIQVTEVTTAKTRQRKHEMENQVKLIQRPVIRKSKKYIQTSNKNL